MNQDYGWIKINIFIEIDKLNLGFKNDFNLCKRYFFLLSATFIISINFSSMLLFLVYN